MLAALTPTRLGLTVQAMAAMKLGLVIAVRCSHSRRQFGPKDQDEVKIIQHQMQYLRLMLAAALALTFTTRYAAGLVDDALCQGQDLQSNRALQALVAGLKSLQHVGEHRVDFDVRGQQEMDFFTGLFGLSF